MNERINVLLVEDDDWFAEQQTRTLLAAGYIVTRVAHGLAAIEAIDHSTPDIIVLDLFLPGTNALTLLHELQSHTDLASLPVILCSNSASDIPRVPLASYGVRQVLDKTIMQPADLEAAVRRILT